MVHYTASGVIGQPSAATVEKGKALLLRSCSLGHSARRCGSVGPAPVPVPRTVSPDTRAVSGLPGRFEYRWCRWAVLGLTFAESVVRSAAVCRFGGPSRWRADDGLESG
ncbi:hypothetical protein BJ970_007121 [Saccharopolyspora phatthalungensis]|uniref:Uncharacterized protein n=2 Tax=Saccharopolyspora phatthalungensis TaxID=664693 RepID=A0A840QAF7_9PSEU|nr:hypothetical protein [Saccharopolyspora phatthalungensis]